MTKLSIEELAKLLKKEDTFDEQCAIRILPNGEIVPLDDTTPIPKNLKPITFKEDLGGEYSEEVNARLAV